MFRCWRPAWRDVAQRVEGIDTGRVWQCLDQAGLPNILIGGDFGAAHLRLGVHPVQHHPHRLLHRVHGLVKAGFRKTMEDKNTAALTRVLCLAFVVLSYFIANYPTPILEMMSYSWGIISGSFLAPYLLSLYWKNMTKNGALAGIIVGGLTVLIWKQFAWFGLYEIVPGFLFSLIAIYVVSKLDGGPSQEIQDEFEQAIHHTPKISVLHNEDT